MKFIAVIFLLLHGPDGREVYINPEEITSLRADRADQPKDSKMFTEGVHCMVNLSDGKYVTVVESCAVIDKMMEKIR